MKFGLMIVQNTDNIGDDIQTYAAKKFLPNVDFYIDREKLDSFCGDKDNQQVAVIMNGWYMYNKFNWPPSPYINPLLIAMHISKSDYYGIGTKFLDGLGGNYLKRYQPIGARDRATQKILENKGIKSFISGCLTLTIEKFDDVKKTSVVYLVDIDEDVQRKLQNYYPNEKFEIITHFVDYMNNSISYDERMLRVETLLKKYQGAKCVITSRLHCALPCLALEVPVLLIYQDQFKDRMESFLKFINVATPQEIESNQFDFDIENPPTNSQDYLSVRDSIESKCLEFVTQNQERFLECDRIDYYEVLDWQDNLINSVDVEARNQYFEYKQWCEELQKGKDWSESQYKLIKQENDKLKQWCEELQKGKDWSESQYKLIKQENDKLKQWCDELQKGKDWSESQYELIKQENDKLGQWCEELQKGKDWSESQYKLTKEKYDKLKQWCDELQKGKDWVENEWKNKCEERERLKEALADK